MTTWKFSVPTSTAFTAILLAASLTLAGCGGGGEAPPPTASVSGKITSDMDIPFEKLGLNFVQANGSQATTAKIEADGTFSGTGTVGQDKVYLYGITLDPSLGEMHADPSNTKIHKDYWDLTKTPWLVTVEEGGSKGIELKIEKKPSAGGSSGGH